MECSIMMMTLIERTIACDGGAVMTDAELLNHYAESGSQSAFAEIVNRHSPLVYSICLRVLRNPQAAEDATQATFLVLVHKRSSVGKAVILAAWLHRTALYCARNLRRTLARRKHHEVHAGSVTTVAYIPDTSAGDMKTQIDEAIKLLGDGVKSPKSSEQHYRITFIE
jgi:DNA-directed RNA polymerase specialized sigma24 family protein